MAIVITEYDEEWPQQIDALRNALETYLADLVLRTEHVGSTSVPGLAAKPIIDLDVVIESDPLLNTNRQPPVASVLGRAHAKRYWLPFRKTGHW